MGMAAKLQNVAKRNSTPSANNAKAAVRQNVLDVMGADKCHVFDAFAGDGHLYRAVWAKAASCVGCDLKFYNDERMAYVSDNRRVLRMIDLAPFNLFDLDSYGSPWEQLYIIAARRKLKPGEQLGLILTEGQGLKLKMGGMSIALSVLAGVRMNMPGMGRAQNELIDRALQRVEKMMGGTIVKRWQAEARAASTMHYIGMVMVGNEKKQAATEAAA